MVSVSQFVYFCTYTGYSECMNVFTLTITATCSALRDPDGGLKTGKILSVQRCTLFTLSTRHLGYIVEEEGPTSYFHPGGGGRVIAADSDVIHPGWGSNLSQD